MHCSTPTERKRKPMRRVLLSCLMVVVVAWPAAAASAAEEIDWTVTVPSSGTVIGDEVRIEGPGTHRLLTIVDPGIEGDDYLIEGTVRYEGVEPAGYLEMWSFFADGGAYFSRTLAEDGPSAALVGASPRRTFEVPFVLNGSAGPERIEFGVVLPDAGTVWVGPLTLGQVASSTAWWSERRAAQIGATLGVLAGLSGAVIGMLGGRRRGPPPRGGAARGRDRDWGWCPSRSRHRPGELPASVRLVPARPRRRHPHRCRRGTPPGAAPELRGGGAPADSRARRVNTGSAGPRRTACTR